MLPSADEDSLSVSLCVAWFVAREFADADMLSPFYSLSFSRR